MARVLHAAPTRAAGFDAAFTAIDDAGNHPGSVLLVRPDTSPVADLREMWTGHGSPMQLRIADFDTIVTEALEQAHYETRSGSLSGSQRQRLVEAAVDDFDPATHPLGTTRDYASADACNQAEDLLSLLEFAGLTSPDAVAEDDRLDAVPSEIREAAVALSEGLDSRRGRFPTPSDHQRRSLRSERYERATHGEGTPLATVLDDVDAVVFGAFTFFSPLEADLVDAISTLVPDAHAVLPLSGTHGDDLGFSKPLQGIDAGVHRAWHFYEELEFTLAQPDRADRDAGTAIRGSLYRPVTDSEITPETVDSAGVEWYEYPTPDHERRGTVREIRESLADDDELTPGDIGVAVTGLDGSEQALFETFSQFGVPVGMDREVGLDGTELGAAISHALEIGDRGGRVSDLIRLLANPLTDPEWPGEPLTDPQEVGDVTLQPGTDLDVLRSEFDDPDRETALTWLVETCETLATADAASAPAAVAAALDVLGILEDPATSDEWEFRASFEDRHAWMADRERGALTALRDDADSIATAVDAGSGSVSDYLGRALATTTVDCRLGDTRGVDLLSPTDVIHHDFDIVFVMGLTQSAFPTNPTRLSFTRQINDAHPDFEPTDVRERTRYALGLLPASTERVVFSNPAMTADGDETVVAGFLAELDRVCTDDLDPERRDDDAHAPMAREDTQRMIGDALATAAEIDDGETDPTAVATTAVGSGVLSGAPGDAAERLEAGVACATARRSPETTPYDGYISAETRRAFENADDVFSPSRLDTYAACGFKYYMANLLDYDGEEEHTFEANALEAGTFVHNVIARFFRSAQSAPEEPVSIAEIDQPHDVMCRAVHAELKANDVGAYDSPFHAGWLTRLLAGLEPVDQRNPHPGPDGYRGLLVRLLESLEGEQEKLTIRPFLFEAAIGLDNHVDEVGTQLTADPVELVDGVKIRGKVDRVDVVPGTSPRQFVAIDYKTGSSPSIDEVRGGVSFQLPLYLRMLEAVFDDDWEPIGATYYNLNAPASADISNSPLASTEHAQYYRSDGMPLPRSRTGPLFDSHGAAGDDDEDSFLEFLHEEIDERLDRIATAIEDGVFHPTLLDADTAGCEHCDFAHVCDVRHHSREERLENHGQPTAYVPSYAHAEDAEGSR